MTDAKLYEEILADNLKDLVKRSQTLQEVGRKKPSLAEKIISRLKALLDKFISHFKGDLTRTQRDNMHKAFAKNIRSITDEKGNKRYKVHNTTHEIFHADGTPIETFKFDPQMFADSVDNAAKKADNAGKNLTDNQKQNLFDTINKHIDEYISEQVKAGKKESDVAKELTAENSRHRARTLGALKSSLRDFENRANDKEHRRLTVERINKVKGLSDAEIDSAYKRMVDNMREVVDYGGVLYHEIALNRRGDNGKRGELLHWTDAERQRAERETGAGRRINEKHSERQGAFSVAPDDNSNEGWGTKFKTWIKAKWTDRDVKSQRFNRKQTLLLQDVSGYRILYRKYIGDDPVIIDKFAKVIRAKDNYEWETLLPKVGEAIAEKVNLSPSDTMNNYIAIPKLQALVCFGFFHVSKFNE